MRSGSLIAAIFVAGLMHSAPASAQQGEPRLFVFVGAGQQLTSRTFSNGATFKVNAEDARFASTYDVASGMFFKVNGGYLFTRHVGIGAGVTAFSTETDADVTASIPHPFFFGKPRAITGTATGLAREERSVDLHVLVTGTIGQRLRVTVFGGPSLFQVKQDLATSATFSEVYPYDEAKFEGTTTTTSQRPAAGFNAGANLVFLLTERVGVGADLQFSRGTADLSDGTATPVSVDTGGGQIVLGVRFAF